MTSTRRSVLRRRGFLAALSSPAWTAWPGLVRAQAAFPEGPIRLVVPFPPAGGTDVISRLVATKITEGAQWNFVIDNKPGAGGNIGLDAVAKARPDGYTLGMGQTANLAINPALYPKMPYDASRDFTPIALAAGQPMVLVVRAESAYTTLASLVSAAKARPGQLTMASAGNGTVGHLTGEFLKQRAAIDFLHIPYKGAGPAATDLLGGQVDFYFATPQAALPFTRTGKLRALAVSSIKRVVVLPDVPTIAESGYAGFDINDWKVLVGPAGMPAAVVARINAEVGKAMSKPEAVATLEREGSLPLHGSADAVARFLKAELERWGGVIRAAKVRLE